MTQINDFAKWLDEQLHRCGLTGKDLAEKIGVSEATISRIRSGRSKLSPRMRRLLSAGLDVELGKVPNPFRSGSHVDACEEDHFGALQVSVLQGAIPDHACANYAVQKGFFEQRGLVANNITDKDIGLTFPESYWEYIETYLRDGEYVLAVSPDSVFNSTHLTPFASIFSHLYRGYALISRSNHPFSAVDNKAPHERLFALKVLLEGFEHKDMWAPDTLFQRFSWQSLYDFKFIDLIGGLSCEIVRGEKYVPTENYHDREKSGLDSLYDFGKHGSDCVVTDSGNLARALAQPQKYDVLLSYDVLIKVLKALSVDKLPPWASTIKGIYRADKKEVALERFKAFWLSEFGKLETAVRWHLFAPIDHDDKTSKQIVSLLEHVVKDVHNVLCHPTKREAVLLEIMAHLDNTFGGFGGTPNFEYFRLAWERGYGGL